MKNIKANYFTIQDESSKSLCKALFFDTPVWDFSVTEDYKYLENYVIFDEFLLDIDNMLHKIWCRVHTIFNPTNASEKLTKPGFKQWDLPCAFWEVPKEVDVWQDTMALDKLL